ncbi:MAG: hypothetical protein AB7T49_10465 [Oligoflexales bacterium]
MSRLLLFLLMGCTLVAKDPPTKSDKGAADQKIELELTRSLTNIGQAVGQLTRIIDLIDSVDALEDKRSTPSGSDAFTLLAKTMSEVGVASVTTNDKGGFWGEMPSLGGKEYNSKVSFLFDGQYAGRVEVKTLGIHAVHPANGENAFKVFSAEDGEQSQRMLLDLTEVVNFERLLTGAVAATKRKFTSGNVEIIRGETTKVRCENLKWIGGKDIRELAQLEFEVDGKEIKNLVIEGRVLETVTLKELGHLSYQIGSDGEALIKFVDNNGNAIIISPLEKSREL